jgi:hypothetical protein
MDQASFGPVHDIDGAESSDTIGSNRCLKRILHDQLIIDHQKQPVLAHRGHLIVAQTSKS